MIRLLLCLILIALPVRAEMPAGHDDPRFTDAVETWLNADDRGSLPILATLARDGNIAAQILLARIETNRHPPTPWLNALSRPERKALLRADSGPYGGNWLAHAAASSPLADALWESQYSSKLRQTLPILIRLGEVHAAGRQAMRTLGTGSEEQAVRMIMETTEDPQMITIAMRLSLARRGQMSEQMLQRAMARMQSGVPLELLGLARSLMPAPVTDEDHRERARMDWVLDGLGAVGTKQVQIEDGLIAKLSETPLGAPLKTLCSDRCAGNVRACYKSGHQAIGGITGLEELASPVETLISSARYRVSARAANDAFGKMIMNLEAHGRQPLDWFRKFPQDRCLSEMLMEELE